jgi:hypothetical protein
MGFDFQPVKTLARHAFHGCVDGQGIVEPPPIHHRVPNSAKSKQNGHSCQQAKVAARYLELRWELWYNSTSPANCLYQLVGLAVGGWLRHLPAALLLLGYSVADIISR